MVVIACLVPLAFAFSSARFRAAVPFESLLAVGSAAAITLVLFQMGKLV